MIIPSPARKVQMMVVSLNEVTSHVNEPTLTVGSVVPPLNSAPMTVMRVPPAVPPDAGEKEEMLGNAL